MPKLTNLQKTLITAFIFCAVSSFLAYALQNMANKAVSSCSYLDPIIVDVIAFPVGLFLCLEGLMDIFRHKEDFVKSQLARCLRMGIGASILTIHIMQFLYKASPAALRL